MMAGDDSDDDDDDFGLGEEEAEDDFRERTAWQSKNEVKACFGCGKAFSLVTNRHHHCRQCGRVVCGDCSPWKDRVKGYAKPQRTCHGCHEDLANAFGVKKVGLGLLRLCPCFRFLRREVKRQQYYALLQEGAVFVRRRNTSDMAKVAGKALNKLAGSLFGGSTGADDGESLAQSRCRVKLRPDGGSLGVSNVGSEDEDDVIYLHEVQRVTNKGDTGLIIYGSGDKVLFEGAVVEKRQREAWVAALRDLSKEARGKPPPPRTARPKTRMELAARNAKREVELSSRKKDAERRKAEYMKGGGLKYTA
eukprot:CAMPEP_0119265504 /NCGR_PEP_ID=MMETSP1329-20130426/4302_1 /TAXON_ID=114041 /ORGANISM="Genus nov. species nov., Strain RCC1024" /LENGTH=305 /DNA_ID=CAMNT_0007265335 /DNA_START=242 /DNA_END=1156 /DNA_ORIENTATION=-